MAAPADEMFDRFIFLKRQAAMTCYLPDQVSNRSALPSSIVRSNIDFLHMKMSVRGVLLKGRQRSHLEHDPEK
jgi:hypothetical protein